jgi:hypothetical protein
MKRERILMKEEIKWGSPLSMACLGIFLGGLGFFLKAI